MARSNSGKRRHATRRPTVVAKSVGTCAMCGKQDFESRKAARSACKTLYPGAHLTAYQCTGRYWHYGTPPQAAMVGLMSRADVYRSA